MVKDTKEFNRYLYEEICAGVFPLINRILHLSVIAGLVIFSGIVSANEVIEEIVVTASMRSDGYNEMPAITLQRKADFLVQKVRIVNDSRSPKLRRTEILTTIRGLLKSAGRNNNYALSYGEGFLYPVTLDNDSIEIIADRSKADSSYVDISVKVTVEASVTAKRQISDLRKYIASQNVDGRSELLPQGDVGISIINPEQYRYEILRKVADENQKIRDIVGQECQITVGGLEGRVTWDRTAVDQLTLYIPYGTEITCGT